MTLFGNKVTKDTIINSEDGWFGCTLLQYDQCFYKKGGFDCRDSHRKKAMWGETGRSIYQPRGGTWTDSPLFLIQDRSCWHPDSEHLSSRTGRQISAVEASQFSVLCLSGPSKWAGLPRWLSGKESACFCRGCRFDPWIGKISWSRKRQPTSVFLPEKFHGEGSLTGCSPRGYKEVDTTEHMYTYPHGAEYNGCYRRKFLVWFTKNTIPVPGLTGYSSQKKP